MPDLVFKQWLAVVDERTTEICLNTAGQVRAVRGDFDTPNGPMEAPPAHYGCRAIVAPYLSDTEQSGLAVKARAEIRRRAREHETVTSPPKVRPVRRRRQFTRRKG